MVGSVGQKGAKPKRTGEVVRRTSSFSGSAEIEIVSRPPIASANLALPDLVALAADLERAFGDGADGAVITLGTDTLDEVAFALDVLIGSERPVVLTGAMRFANQPGSEG